MLLDDLPILLNVLMFDRQTLKLPKGTAEQATLHSLTVAKRATADQDVLSQERFLGDDTFQHPHTKRRFKMA